MFVNAAAATGAAVATVLVALVGAPQPAQVIVSSAAGAAFLAILLQGRHARMTDWFTVRVLLAGNLLVFGIANITRVGALLATFAILSGSVLLLGAVIAYARELRGRRSAR